MYISSLKNKKINTIAVCTSLFKLKPYKTSLLVAQIIRTSKIQIGFEFLISNAMLLKHRSSIRAPARDVKREGEDSCPYVCF